MLNSSKHCFFLSPLSLFCYLQLKKYFSPSLFSSGVQEENGGSQEGVSEGTCSLSGELSVQGKQDRNRQTLTFSKSTVIKIITLSSTPPGKWFRVPAVCDLHFAGFVCARCWTDAVAIGADFTTRRSRTSAAGELPPFPATATRHQSAPPATVSSATAAASPSSNGRPGFLKSR